ncbi:MAG: thioredoxin fold domain-containing protein [Gammaproteobacteria bacterium]|nr:thioredoxin fold domain-containing protein [Gammaproteobacteria bacterium]
MKINPILQTFIFLFIAFGSSQAIAAKAGKITGGVDFDTPSWFKDSFLEIAEDVAEASESGKHVLMFFHLNGCPYCNRMINQNFQQEPLKSQIQANFDSIEINIKGDREIAMTEDMTTTESVLANYLKVQYTPTILFLDGNNKTVLRLNGYRSPEALKMALDFVQQKAYEKSSFSEFKRNNMKYGQYQLIDNSLFVKTTNFSTLKKPVAILFEDNDCNECEHFHNKMLSREEIRQQLKNYHVVRLDAKSTQPITDFDGHKTTARDWADTLKINYRPGLVIFDEGKEIVRTESMLYPFHFEHVLRLGLNKNYLTYPDYLSLMDVRQQKLLAQGIDVNIGKPADW